MASPKWATRGGSQYQPPVLRFKGTLTNAPDGDPFGEGVDNFGKATYVLYFKDVQVLEQTVPFMESEYAISLKQGDNENAQWGIFTARCLELGLDEETESPSDLIGMTLEMYWGAYDYGEIDGKPRTGRLWQLAAIEGRGNASKDDEALALAIQLSIGKTEADLLQALVGNQAVTQDIKDKVMNHTFVSELVSAGRITVADDGVIAAA